MSADKPPGDNPDRPTPPKVEDRVVPTRPGEAGSKHHAADVNNAVHAKLAEMGGRARAAVGQVKDTARNLADQAQIGGKLAIEGAVDTGRKVAHGARVATEKLEKPATAATALTVGVLGTHLPLHLDTLPTPASHGDTISAKASHEATKPDGKLGHTTRPTFEAAKPAPVERPAAGHPDGPPTDPEQEKTRNEGIDHLLGEFAEKRRQKEEAEEQ